MEVSCGSGASSSAEAPRGVIGQRGRRRNKETRPLLRLSLPELPSAIKSATPRAQAAVVILIGAAVVSALLLLTSTPSFVDRAAALSIDNSCCAIGATVLQTSIAEFSKCTGQGCDTGDTEQIIAGLASDVFILSHNRWDQLFINTAGGAFVEPNA